MAKRIAITTAFLGVLAGSKQCIYISYTHGGITLEEKRVIEAGAAAKLVRMLGREVSTIDETRAALGISNR